MESKILNLIKSAPDWRDCLEHKKIRIKEEFPFAIFNYGPDVDPLDPVVREARGIIIDLDKKEVVCWPFTRFYNSYEEAAKEDLDNFDWEHCRVEEKIDGSICKLFFNEYTNNWQWATNSCIDAPNATTFSDMSFQKIIESAINYHDITFESLDKHCTYIFELISPYQRIVIHYPETKLYHIGTRNNVTGEEDWIYIGIEHPHVYWLDTLDDCLVAAQELNEGINQVTEEGFVVVDKNWRRLKIKSPEYIAAHRLMANRSINKEHIIDVILESPETVNDICRSFPELALFYRYYQYKMEELEYDVQQFINYVRELYEEYNHDRKAVALTIKSFPLASFGFEALKTDADAKELLANTIKSRYLKLIPDYVPNDVIHGNTV